MSLILFLALSLGEPTDNYGGVTVTILHTTDIHGWIYGHRHQPNLNADAGDLYNFIYHRKKNKASNEIVLAFDTGDMIEGTGLSDYNGTRGIEIFNIMKDIPYDGLVNGNHDIKYDKSVDLIVKTFQPAHAGKYLAGQAVYVPTGKKLGNNFRTISLGEGNGKILVLGFTYNIANVQKKVKVTGVAAFLNQEWFGRAMASKDTRAIVVLCHINTDHTHIANIKKILRAKKPKTPIIFLTGHSHQERTQKLDTEAFAMESGRYFNKIGVMKFALPKTASATSNFAELTEFNGGLASGLDMTTFNQKYLETNVALLQAEAGVSAANWNTAVGSRIKSTIQTRLNAFGLLNKQGCSPKRYSNSATAADADSIYRLLVDTVFPKVGPKRGNVTTANGENVESVPNAVTTLYIQQANMRYPLFQGAVLKDDIYNTDPMAYEHQAILGMTGAHLKKLWGATLATSNSDSADEDGVEHDEDMDGAVSNAIFKTNKFITKHAKIADTALYDIFMDRASMKQAIACLKKIAPGKYTMRKTSVSTRDSLKVYVKNYWKC
ncbi:putative 5' nucleotidase family protein [Blattamonas nauphoetae]|uniref:5' nucleotidase family protein n=1 Tax=Blattamonas nauphoetae TaxID=2049346 RepID=A0ABQ9WYV3_9EUKA|nr:putative 5' nucleotidase family protein [Blattamonas nauphoetae]